MVKSQIGFRPREMYFAINFEHLFLLLNMMIANDVTEEMRQGNKRWTLDTPPSYKIGLIVNGKTY